MDAINYDDFNCNAQYTGHYVCYASELRPLDTFSIYLYSLI